MHPEGKVAGMLGLKHIILMIICYSMIILIGYLMRDVSKKKINLFYKIYAIIILLLDPLYLFWEYKVSARINVATSLPLYFCSIFIFTFFIFAFTKSNSKINEIAKTYICTMNILSSILGTVFLVYLNDYPLMHFVIIRSLFFHFSMFLIPTIIYFRKEFTYQKNHRYLFMIPALALMIPVFILDLAHNWDYCYFNGGRGTPVSLFVGFMPPIIRLISIPTFFLIATNLLVVYPNYKLSKKNN